MIDSTAAASGSACPVSEALRRTVGAHAVLPRSAPGAFHNTHFRAILPRDRTVFVKVFTDAAYWRRAIAAAAVVEPLIATPRLLDHGPLDSTGDRTSRWWITYQWLDLTPFTPAPDLLAQVGTMLGRLHAATRGQVTGFAEHDLDAEILERAGHLAPIAPDLADRIRALHARWGPTQLPGQIGLIHGDVHPGNLALHDGTPLLLDLENVRAARPLVDFGKLADLGVLADPAHRYAFFTGYTRHAPPVWPWPEEMRAVRLWTTAGVLVYAHATGLSGFADHGRWRLAELESEYGIGTP